MGRIRILPEKVANQIAAGEVIERPASVVRELLDNSIDAGAKSINLKIDEGGKQLIRLSDDGVGMNKDDMLLSLERHATSKINDVSDLFSIKTMGFRGEALPSIASVSKMEITSRTIDQLEGYRIRASGGEIRSIDETGAPAGTTVEVRDLYFNTPARRKFLKTVKTETGHIVDTISKILLPFTRIQLRIDQAGKTLLNLPSSENEMNRLSALFGRDVAVSLMDTFGEIEGLKIRAYLAPPEFSRSRSDRIFIYINKRNISDRVITGSIMNGYGQRLMKGRYPQAVVFVQMDSSLVDINVHPSKKEVRFHESRFVYQGISKIIEKALKDHLKPFPPVSRITQFTKTGDEINGESISEPLWHYSEEDLPNRNTIAETAPQSKALHRESARFIGSLKETYLLFQTDEGLLLIDQHAAHERVLYETIKKDLLSSRKESQFFLIPARLELSLKDGRMLLGKMNQMAELGFDIEHFGGNTFLLRSVPSIMVDTDWEEFILDLLPVLDEEDFLNEKIIEKIVTVMSCHGAIKAGQRMNDIEIMELFKQLEGMDLPTNCPHGRPIFKKFSYYEIEKMFKRVL